VIVIDASSLAKYVIKEGNWVSVEEYLLSREVLTLDLAVKEVLNAVWKHAAVLHTYSTEIAIEKYDILMKLVEGGVITVDDEMPYLKEAFNIALKARITIYDAL
jgi:predicted nucleic acid-binding protein